MRKLLTGAALCALIAGQAGAASDPALLGAWRLDDGRIFTLSPSADDSWRYRFVDDGSSGRLYPRATGSWSGGAGFNEREPIVLQATSVGPDGLRWQRADAATQVAQRIPVRERELALDAGGVRLHARLVWPTTPGPHPLVVLVHGSERSAAVGAWYEPYQLAAHGIAALVYDKRGTGRSQGSFSANFALLAQDAAAAARLAAAQPEIDPKRIGFAGFSQGGWVAPLAAEQFGSARAVLVGYGSVHSPLHEDRFQCLFDLRAAGADAEALAEADALVSAAHTLLLTGLKEGWALFQQRAERVAQRPWFKQLDEKRCIAAGFAAYPAWVLRMFAPSRLPPGIDWNYDSEALLTRLKLPMLWQLAQEDREAPAQDTAATLQRLAKAGKPYEVQMFPLTDHGILRYQEQNGVRIPTGYDPAYFRSALAFWQRQFKTSVASAAPSP